MRAGPFSIMDVTITWWALVSIGVALVIAEVFIGAFIVMWFGFGAIVTGLLTLAVPDMNVGVQALISTLIGSVLMYFFRDRYVAQGNAEQETLHTFTATTGQISVNGSGRISVFANGTFWGVANPDDIPEEKRIKGSTVTIAEFRNNMAFVEKPDSAPS